MDFHGVAVLGLCGNRYVDCQVWILITKGVQVVRHGQIIRFSVAFTSEKPTSLLLQELRLSIILKENFSGWALF